MDGHLALNKKARRKQHPRDAKPAEQAGIVRSPSGSYVAKSNFDELTPEEQEQVRARLARFFVSIYNTD